MNRWQELRDTTGSRIGLKASGRVGVQIVIVFSGITISAYLFERLNSQIRKPGIDYAMRVWDKNGAAHLGVIPLGQSVRRS